MNSSYGVGDDEDLGLGGSLGGSLSKVADNGGVGVEQVWPCFHQYSTSSGIAKS